MASKALLSGTIHSAEIEMRPLKAMPRPPTTVLVGISSEGIVGPLVASHLIHSFAMEQVYALDSPLFPPLSMVYFQKPKFPARIYSFAKHRLAVVVAEFAPDPETARALALCIRSWCDGLKVKRVIAIEGFDKGDVQPPVPVAAVGSTDDDRAATRRSKIPQLQHGAVAGVAGVLLNEGRWRNKSTIALAASIDEAGPNAQAALEVVRTLRRLLPRLPIPLDPSPDGATQLEKAIQDARDRTSNLAEFV